MVLAALWGLAMVPVPGPGGAAAGPPGSADLQWAQQSLKDKGFDPGRPTGEMTAKTRAALSAFQHAMGLPATGELDDATTARLMAARPASPTVGTLAAPTQHSHDGHGPGGHEATAPAPHAAPSGRVEAGGGGDVPVFGAGGGSAAGGGVPRAAPSGSVTAATVASPPLLPGALPSADAQSFALVAPAWLRDGVVGVIVAILGGFGALWWWSGRRPAGRGPALSVEAEGPVRIEPRFGAADRPRAGRRDLHAERF